MADVNLHTCTSTTAAGSDTYAYDEVDSRTRVTEANGAATSDRFYCCDARNQLIYRNTGAACSSSAKDESYTYDDAGNRTSALVAGSTRTFTYTPDGQLTACANPACTITYDTTGRTSAWTDNGITWAYTYDSAGRLTSACKAASCTGSGFDRLDFAYDGEGHRTKITETPAAPTIQTPVITRDFRYQGDAVVEELVNTVSLRTIVVDEAGAPVKLTIAVGQPNAGTYLPTWSGHGDLLALWQVQADGSLVLANSVTYDTWGRPSVTSANGIPDLGWSRLYVGRSDVWWDNAFGAGLTYMHARTYVPALGRFLQPDPIAAEGNLYGYAENSPITKADPSGTFAWCAIPVVGWAICSTAVRAVATAVGGWLLRNGQVIATRGPAIINAVKDSAGRIQTVTATLTRLNISMGTRVTEAARRICCRGLTGYDAGHLVARILGGPGGARSDNVVAILTKVNRGEMRILEGRIRALVERGSQVEVRITLKYEGSGSVPSAILYEYRVHNARFGQWFTTTFTNK